MYYYHSHGYDTTKEDARAIFAQASDSGTLKKFNAPWSWFWFWSSTEGSGIYSWPLGFCDGYLRYGDGSAGIVTGKQIGRAHV